jgi:hypothetical protein
MEDNPPDIQKDLTCPTVSHPTKTYLSASSDEAVYRGTTDDAGAADAGNSGARANHRFLIISAAFLALLLAVAVGLSVALVGRSDSSNEKSSSEQAAQQQQAGDNPSIQTAATLTTPTTPSPSGTPLGRPARLNLLCWLRDAPRFNLLGCHRDARRSDLLGRRRKSPRRPPQRFPHRFPR